MILYGSGTLTEKNSSRVIHDFIDGPYETVNQEVIKWALESGFTDKKPDDIIHPIHNEKSFKKGIIKKMFGKVKK